MTVPNYFEMRKISPHYPTEAEVKARLAERNRRLGKLALSIGWTAIGIAFLAIVIGSR